MKCLSLWQPFASLMVAGKKRCETRSWQMLHRGPLLIHAAKRFQDDQSDLCFEEPFATVLREMGVMQDMPLTEMERAFGGVVTAKTVLTFALGAIIGRVDVVDCYATERVGCVADAAAVTPMRMPGDKLYVSATEYAFGDFSPGRFAFLCENPVQFAKPTPFKGCIGLFDVPDELVTREMRGEG